MTLRERPYILFFSFALAAFAIAHIGFAVLARLYFRDRGLVDALSETMPTTWCPAKESHR